MPNNYKNIVILSGTTAYTDNDVFAIYNPTGASINAVVKGSIKTIDSGSYVDDSGEETIAIAAGYTLYARFSSVKGAGLIIMY